jgi:hypothetical protein
MPSCSNTDIRRRGDIKHELYRPVAGHNLGGKTKEEARIERPHENDGAFPSRGVAFEKRERGGQKDWQTQREETERQTRKTDRQSEGRDRQSEIDRQTNRARDKARERERERAREGAMNRDRKKAANPSGPSRYNKERRRYSSMRVA